MGLNPANIGRILEGIGRRLRLLVDRAVVRIVTDSLGRQNLQIQSLADSTNDDVERFQNYGLTSVPPVGSEALILAVGDAGKVWWQSLLKTSAVVQKVWKMERSGYITVMVSLISP